MLASAVVTTGMVSYKDLAKAQSPSLATAFELVGANWAAKIISFGISRLNMGRFLLNISRNCRKCNIGIAIVR